MRAEDAAGTLRAMSMSTRTCRWAALAVGVVLASCRCGVDDGDLGALVAAIGSDVGSVAFDDTYVGASRTQDVLLSALASDRVRFDDVRVESAGAFSFVDDAPTFVDAGDSVTVRVRFAPSAAAAVEGTLVVDSDASNRPRLSLALSGTGLTPLDCDDGNACTAESFDATLGVCVRTNSAGPCDDASACTSDDHCDNGACVGTAVVCADAVACTLDTCDPSVGCLFVPQDDACADDDGCSLDQCNPGSGCTHAPAPDGTPCGDFVQCQSIDVCVAQVCTPFAVPDGTPCSDGDLCSIGDVCAQGTCAGVLGEEPPGVVQTEFLSGTPHSALFVGDALYLGADTLRILDANDDALPVHGARGDIALPTLVRVDATHVAAITADLVTLQQPDTFDGPRFDVTPLLLDVSDPFEPVVVAIGDSVQGGANVRGGGAAYAAGGDSAYVSYCVPGVPSAEPPIASQLVRVHADDMAASDIVVDSALCDPLKTPVALDGTRRAMHDDDSVTYVADPYAAVAVDSLFPFGPAVDLAASPTHLTWIVWQDAGNPHVHVVDAATLQHQDLFEIGMDETLVGIADEHVWLRSPARVRRVSWDGGGAETFSAVGAFDIAGFGLHNQHAKAVESDRAFVSQEPVSEASNWQIVADAVRNDVRFVTSTGHIERAVADSSGVFAASQQDLFHFPLDGDQLTSPRAARVVLSFGGIAAYDDDMAFFAPHPGYESNVGPVAAPFARNGDDALPFGGPGLAFQNSARMATNGQVFRGQAAWSQTTSTLLDGFVMTDACVGATGVGTQALSGEFVLEAIRPITCNVDLDANGLHPFIVLGPTGTQYTNVSTKLFKGYASNGYAVFLTDRFFDVVAPVTGARVFSGVVHDPDDDFCQDEQYQCDNPFDNEYSPADAAFDVDADGRPYLFLTDTGTQVRRLWTSTTGVTSWLQTNLDAPPQGAFQFRSRILHATLPYVFVSNWRGPTAETGHYVQVFRVDGVDIEEVGSFDVPAEPLRLFVGNDVVYVAHRDGVSVVQPPCGASPGL